METGEDSGTEDQKRAAVAVLEEMLSRLRAEGDVPESI